MNFEQWFDRLPDIGPFINDTASAELGWCGCKGEILTLIEERAEKCCGTKGVELERIAQIIRTVV